MNVLEINEQARDEEISQLLFQKKNIRIERILSFGQTTDWYDQTEYEFVVLLKGQARLEFEGGQEKSLVPGDSCLILPHQRHRVSYTEHETIWLCVFYQE